MLCCKSSLRSRPCILPHHSLCTKELVLVSRAVKLPSTGLCDLELLFLPPSAVPVPLISCLSRPKCLLLSASFPDSAYWYHFSTFGFSYGALRFRESLHFCSYPRICRWWFQEGWSVDSNFGFFSGGLNCVVYFVRSFFRYRWTYFRISSV